MPYYASGAKDAEVIHRGPCMLAPIVNAAGKFRALHMTWFDLTQPDGKVQIKDPETGDHLPAKKVRGSKAGNRIEVVPRKEATQLIMGEGIETVLSVWCGLLKEGGSLGDTAFWSAVDLGNLGGRADRDRFASEAGDLGRSGTTRSGALSRSGLERDRHSRVGDRHGAARRQRQRPCHDGMRPGARRRKVGEAVAHGASRLGASGIGFQRPPAGSGVRRERCPMELQGCPTSSPAPRRRRRRMMSARDWPLRDEAKALTEPAVYRAPRKHRREKSAAGAEAPGSGAERIQSVPTPAAPSSEGNGAGGALHRSCRRPTTG